MKRPRHNWSVRELALGTDRLALTNKRGYQVTIACHRPFEVDLKKGGVGIISRPFFLQSPCFKYARALELYQLCEREMLKATALSLQLEFDDFDLIAKAHGNWEWKGIP